MKIRRAGLEDVVALNKLVNRAYRGDESKKGWTTEAELLTGIRTSEASLTEMMETAGATIEVLKENEEITACVYLQKKGEVLYLGMLTVAPEQQGKGIGAILLQAAEKKALALSCSKIQMTVITVRDTLIAYYQRKGFQDTGERIPFPDDPKFGIPKQRLEFMVMEKEIKKEL